MKQNRRNPKHTLAAFVVGCAGLSFAGPAAGQAVPVQHAAHAPSQTGQFAQPPAQQQPAMANPDTTITLRTIGSDLEFLPSEIAVTQGKRLRIRYVNQGTFPHNIVVVKNEKDIDPLGIAAFNAGSTGYVPLDMSERMVAHSPLAPPGETIEFTFVVPPPGDYPFVCLYPGHYNMMVGTLRSLR